jgi:hypothetical protein
MWCAAIVALTLFADTAAADTPATVAAPNKSEQPDKTRLDSITVEAKRERAILERQVSTFVSGITTIPLHDSLARWGKQSSICPLVAGLPREQGEFMLTRLSNIALAAGAPLAPEQCKANFYVVVTSVPDALMKAWERRDITMFGEAGGGKINRFLKSDAPIRVWYNATLYTSEGTPLTADMPGLGSTAPTPNGSPLPGVPTNSRAMNFRLSRDEVRDLTSVIVLIDARRAKGVSYGQLAAYIAMVGLAEIRMDAQFGDAPTILNLFKNPQGAPPLGLSSWDQAYLKALYHTQHEDPMQLGEMKTSMLHDIAP